MVEEFEPGSRYNINKEEEKIEIVKELVESDVEVRGDKRTFQIMREVGDSLEGMIRLAHFHVQIGVLLPLLCWLPQLP